MDELLLPSKACIAAAAVVAVAVGGSGGGGIQPLVSSYERFGKYPVNRK